MEPQPQAYLHINVYICITSNVIIFFRNTVFTSFAGVTSFANRLANYNKHHLQTEGLKVQYTLPKIKGQRYSGKRSFGEFMGHMSGRQCCNC